MLPQTGPSLWAWARGQGMLGMPEELYRGGKHWWKEYKRFWRNLHIVWIRGLIIADDTMKTHWLGKHPNTISFSSFFIFLRTKHAVLMHQWINESKTLQAEAGSEALAGLGDLKDFVGGVFLGLEKKQLDWSIDHDLRILFLCTYEVIWMWFTCSC